MVEGEGLARLERPADRGRHVGAVVGMDQLEVALVRDRPRGRVDAEDPIGLVGPRDAVAGDVPFPAADPGGRLRVAQELRLPPQLLFGAVAGDLSDGGVLEGPTQRQGALHGGPQPEQPVLHDEVDRAFLDEADRGLFVERSGDDDDGRERPFALHHMQRVERAELRQRVVGQHDIRGEVVQGMAQVGSALHALGRAAHAGAAQLAEQELRVGGDVLYQQDAEWLA